jgi:AraC-like DNA-binding protein
VGGEQTATGVSRREVALLETSLGGVYEVEYRTSARHFRPRRPADVTHVVLPRRGAFILERYGARTIIDATTAAIIAAGDECRVGYPAAGGDDCIVLVLAPDLLEESLGAVTGRVAPLDATTHLAVSAGISSIKQNVRGSLAAEESMMLLLSSLTPLFASNHAEERVRVHAAQRWRIEQVRARLASAPELHWDLATIARTVHVSPFHLARQFRAVTGETISRHLLQLRIALAIRRLAEGETDLALLAVETGFANHSHFTARFRHLVGVTPSAARHALASERTNGNHRAAAASPCTAHR